MQNSAIAVVVAVAMALTGIGVTGESSQQTQGLLTNPMDTADMTVIADNTVLRDGPSLSYPALSILDKGDKVKTVYRQDDWIQVKTSTNLIGWLEMADLTTSGSVSADKTIALYVSPETAKSATGRNLLSSSKGIATEIISFAFYTNANGDITGSPLKNISSALSGSDVSNIMLVSNADDTGFNRDTAHRLITNRSSSLNFIRNIRHTLEKYGFDGINLDLENIPPSDRRYFTEFVKELSKAVRPDYSLSISAPAKTWDDPNGAWSGAYDYRELAKQADRIALMAYDQHYAGGSPGPVASKTWVEKVVKYAASQIPSEKLLLGVPAYGYDWDTATNNGRTVSYRTASNLASSLRIKPSWSDTDRVPYFEYSSGGAKRQVWYENADSLKEKLAVAESYDLAGVAIWRSGLEDPGIWPVIKSYSKDG